MTKRTGIISCFLVIFVLLLLQVSIGLASSSTGIKIWPSMTTTNVNKIWTISFDNLLLASSVNSTSIYITDTQQKNVPTSVKLSANGLSVTVTPNGTYSAGDYNLYITKGVTSQSGAALNEVNIIPFTVTPLQGENIVVTVTDDFKAVNPSAFSGAFSLVDSSGNGYGPVFTDASKGKYTFNVNTDGDYYVKLFTYSDGIITTELIKAATIKLSPAPSNTSSNSSTIKSVNVSLVVPTKAGVIAGKSGSIGGTVTPETWGVPVNVTNSTTTWTTMTDSNGKFLVNLPAGKYNLVVNGNGDQYKKHSYTLTVTNGQMSSPPNQIDVEEPIN